MEVHEFPANYYNICHRFVNNCAAKSLNQTPDVSRCALVQLCGGLSVRVALLEDDPHLGSMVVAWLEDAGHACELFATGGAFKKALARESYDLLILDRLLPDTTGDAMLLWARENVNWRIPIVFVSVRASEEDVMRGLQLGADGYLCKPLRRGEFLSRIASLGRWTTTPKDETESVIDAPPYRIDTAARVVTSGGKLIVLTTREFDLAVFLFRRRGRPLSRGHIAQCLWGQEPAAATTMRAVDTHVSRLRTKLGFAAEPGWSLTSLYNYGYRLDDVPTEAPQPALHGARRRYDDDLSRPLRRRDDPRSAGPMQEPTRAPASE